MRILFFFLLLTPVVSVATTVKCSNAEYANKELRFYRLADPISGDTEHAFSLKFDANGTANASINHSLTLYTFSDFGVYRGMLLLEPGKTITLKLPPFREKSFGDQKNPYFSPVSFWFHSESSIHLTDKVSSFDQKLNSLTNKYFNELYLSQSKTVFDSVQLRLNNSFPEVSPQAFNLHKQLRLKFIKADIFRQRPEEYSEFFTDIKDEFWIHQEFVALFEKTFNEQLSFSAKAIGGKEIFTAVEKQDMKALLSFVEKKFKTTGKMADLVLLKLLHDGFYSNDFSQISRDQGLT